MPEDGSAARVWDPDRSAEFDEAQASDPSCDVEAPSLTTNESCAQKQPTVFI
jgi:hypothetical protein